MSIRLRAWGCWGGLAIAAVLLAACSSGRTGGAKAPDCVGGDCTGAGGTGGAGGAGGSAGGGTGGTGGAPPSCAPACNPGETCVGRDGGGACECAAGSCPALQFCNDGLRCEPEQPIFEGLPCETEGQYYLAPGGSRFYCTALLSFMGLRWVRVCADPEDCPGPHSICLGELVGYNVAPFCMANGCGVLSLGPRLDPPLPANGEPFGPCSATDGYVGMGAIEDGTCSPRTLIDGSVGGLCIRTGAASKGDACRPDAFRGQPDALCEADSMCLSYLADRPGRSCARDADCADIPVTVSGKTRWVDGYCGHDGTCWNFGFCGDACNFGTAGAAAHPNAGCTDPVAVCQDLSRADEPYPVLEGYCAVPCTMFDENACPDWPAGQRRVCYPSFDDTAPLTGICVDRAGPGKTLGEACDDALHTTECPANAACLSLSMAGPSTCVQWCHCEAGFATTRACLDAAVNAGCAPAGTSCIQAVHGSPLGICAAGP